MNSIQEMIFQHVLTENQILTKEQIDECLKLQAQTPKPKPLAFYLITKGYINDRNLEEILFKQREYLTKILKGDVTDKFGEIGIKEGFFTEDTLKEALSIQKKTRDGEKVRPLGQILFLMNALNRDQLEQILILQGKKAFYCRCCKKKFHVKSFKGKKKHLCPKCQTPLVLTNHSAQLPQSDRFSKKELEKLVFDQRKSLNAILKEEPKFGEIGITEGFFSKGLLEEALVLQNEAKKQGRDVHIGEILSLMNAINQDQLEAILLLQGKKPLVCSYCKEEFYISPFSSERSYTCPRCKKKSAITSSGLQARTAEEVSKKESVSEGSKGRNKENAGEIVYSPEEVTALIDRIDTLVDEKFNIEDLKQQAYEEIKHESKLDRKFLFLIREYFVHILCLTGVIIFIVFILFVQLKEIESGKGGLQNSSSSEKKTPQDSQYNTLPNSIKSPETQGEKGDLTQIIRLNPRVLSLGVWGKEKGAFASPWENNLFGPISFSYSHNDECLYILDQNNKRVQKFSTEGSFIDEISLPDFCYEDIDIDETGNIYVLDSYKHRNVSVYDERGKSLLEYPISESIQEPQGIYIRGKKLIIQDQQRNFFELNLHGRENRLPGLPTQWSSTSFVLAYSLEKDKVELNILDSQGAVEKRILIDHPHIEIVLLDTDSLGRIFVGIHYLLIKSNDNKTPINEFLIFAYKKEATFIGTLAIENSDIVYHRHKIRLASLGQIAVLEGTKERVVIKYYSFPQEIK